VQAIKPQGIYPLSHLFKFSKTCLPQCTTRNSGHCKPVNQRALATANSTSGLGADSHLQGLGLQVHVSQDSVCVAHECRNL
jgi:hypothetical protein